jgi:hypothetical protein
MPPSVPPPPPTSTPPPPPPGAPPPPPPGLQAPPGYAGYQYGPTVPTRRIGGLATSIVIFTAIAGVTGLLSAILSAGIADDARDYLAGDLSEDDFAAAVLPLSGAQLLGGIATLVTAVLTIIWMYRIATNLRAFGRRTTWHPLFSIFGWFLPPGMLYVIPFLVLREQWKGSDPEHLDGTERWKQSRDTPWLWLWFLFYGIVPAILVVVQIGSVVGTGFGAADLEGLAESLEDVDAITFVSGAVTAAAAVTWIVFVRQLTGRHRTLTSER